MSHLIRDNPVRFSKQESEAQTPGWAAGKTQSFISNPPLHTPHLVSSKAPNLLCLFREGWIGGKTKKHFAFRLPVPKAGTGTQKSWKPSHGEGLWLMRNGEEENLVCP